ncbi:hypothetical protein [Pseudarthrobacter sp. NamB4]|uniref:hypothetical protein n=1 Tax=Pseudarthrobacter sp. NamB4 TaxID=2576837 RepID=UPI0010FD8886|nr:hypothetical protein [Pseudarthrobacter sp. NamB4]TLM73146.1 hypothetical protein FDW81_10770 [Pseudarthrobacter sp. NamB4]
MTKREIFIALSAEDNLPRGNIWRITAKKTDFYLDFEGDHAGGFHLSMHGPSRNFGGHRFHIKANEQAISAARAKGAFVEHDLGQVHKFDGVQLADHAYRVARLRFAWDLQRPRFRDAALLRNPMPQLGLGRNGKILKTPLPPNCAWDIDFVVAYGEPYWPDANESERDKSRIGPLANDAGMWLTATSYHRPQDRHPSPEDLQLPTPRTGETPSSIMAGGPGPLGGEDMYWFVEGVTSRELLAKTAVSRGRKLGLPST